MYFKLVGVLAIGVIAVGVLTTANAQQSGPAAQSVDAGGQIVDIGKYEYDGHCAICHGLSGTGQGIEPYWNFLNKTPANLTTLSKNNGGVFPFARVYQTIDGREQIQAHGTREMPVWGREYMAMSANINPYYNQEAFARAKILALTEYVYRLQVK
jgi:mono/diheme cytochrome c family protein